jgi:hypothetical protein
MECTLINKTDNAFATDVWFADSKLFVRLTDGREIGVPIDWFPALRDASEEERNDWRFIGKGQGIHWQSLDEDLSVAGFLRI